MQTRRLFFYLQRFNTLLPATVALLLLAGLGWELLSGLTRGGPQTVDPPAGAANGPARGAVPLQIRSSSIEVGPHTLLMRIVAPKGGGGYEGDNLETRNLLFLSDGAEQAHWLFADASQAITELRALNTEAKTPLALYLETVARPTQASNAGSAGSARSRAHVSAYLVSPDGLRKRAIATELDDILSQRQHGQTLQLVYQKGQAVRVMRISLLSFEVLTDRTVATLSEVQR